MKRSALAIGAFVLGAAVLIVAAIIGLGSTTLWERRTPAVVYFEGSVKGLYVGAPVTFRGVQVGQVESIGINVDEKTLAASIPVSLLINTKALRFGDGQVRSDIRTLVQRGLRARFGLQSFVTNQALVDLDFRPDVPAKLHGPASEPEIPVVRDRIEAFVEQVTDLPIRELVDDLRRTMAASQQTLVSARQALDVLAQDTRSTTAQARQTLATAQTALETLQHSAQGTLGAVEKLADTARGATTQLTPEVQRTLQTTREAADAARQAVQRVGDLAAPGAPLREDLGSAVRDLSQAARNLKDLSELLDDRPNVLIFGRKEP